MAVTRVDTPAWLRFRTGSQVETAVVVLMAVSGVGAMRLLGATR